MACNSYSLLKYVFSASSHNTLLFIYYVGSVPMIVLKSYTVKPVCNDHIYHKMYYLWFIQ